MFSVWARQKIPAGTAYGPSSVQSLEAGKLVHGGYRLAKVYVSDGSKNKIFKNYILINQHASSKSNYETVNAESSTSS